jgi:hypothetical protein
VALLFLTHMSPAGRVESRTILLLSPGLLAIEVLLLLAAADGSSRTTQLPWVFPIPEVTNPISYLDGWVVLILLDEFPDHVVDFRMHSAIVVVLLCLRDLLRNANVFAVPTLPRHDEGEVEMDSLEVGEVAEMSGEQEVVGFWELLHLDLERVEGQRDFVVHTDFPGRSQLDGFD